MKTRVCLKHLFLDCRIEFVRFLATIVSYLFKVSLEKIDILFKVDETESLFKTQIEIYQIPVT